jgi:Protein of unknown function (DUF4058)
MRMKSKPDLPATAKTPKKPRNTAPQIVLVREADTITIPRVSDSTLNSPFPGFDPWLEDPVFWEDFHRQFIVDLAREIVAAMPGSYDARIDQRLRVIERETAHTTFRQPDIGIEYRGVEYRGGSSDGGVATLDAVSIEPQIVTGLETIEERDVWIEIVRLPDRKLVTAIEVLSPSNKTNEGIGEYRGRRSEYHQQRAHVVEIDFLQGGRRTDYTSHAKTGDCFYSVARYPRSGQVEVYAWSLKDKLPTLPIPLKAPDKDLAINFAKVFQQTFTLGRYRNRLRYGEYAPPVKAEHQPWAEGLRSTTV